jgi:DNA-binding transcriptional MerR regulator
VSKSRDYQERLVHLVEETISQLKLLSDQLRTIVDNQRSVGARNHVTGIADHLDVVAHGLFLALRNEPRGRIVSALASVGRVTLTSLFAVPIGVGEEVGRELIESVREPATTADSQLVDLAALAEVAILYPVVDEQPENEPDESPSNPDAGYTGSQAARIVGVTERQLDYWARTGLIHPMRAGDVADRRYSYRDLLELRMITSLLDAGIRLESVRDVFASLRDTLAPDIASANIVIDGKTSVVLRTDDQLIELMSRGGQGVLNIVPLASVMADVDAGIGSLSQDEQRHRRTSATRTLPSPVARLGAWGWSAATRSARHGPRTGRPPLDRARARTRRRDTARGLRMSRRWRTRSSRPSVTGCTTAPRDRGRRRTGATAADGRDVRGRQARARRRRSWRHRGGPALGHDGDVGPITLFEMLQGADRHSRQFGDGPDRQATGAELAEQATGPGGRHA